MTFEIELEALLKKYPEVKSVTFKVEREITIGNVKKDPVVEAVPIPLKPETPFGKAMTEADKTLEHLKARAGIKILTNE